MHLHHQNINYFRIHSNLSLVMFSCLLLSDQLILFTFILNICIPSIPSLAHDNIPRKLYTKIVIRDYFIFYPRHKEIVVSWNIFVHDSFPSFSNKRTQFKIVAFVWNRRIQYHQSKGISKILSTASSLGNGVTIIYKSCN